MITRIKTYTVSVPGAELTRKILVTFYENGKVTLKHGKREHALDFGSMFNALRPDKVFLVENKREVYYRIEKNTYWIEIGFDFHAHPKHIKWFLRGDIGKPRQLPIMFGAVTKFLIRRYRMVLTRMDAPEDITEREGDFIIDFEDIAKLVNVDREKRLMYITLPAKFDIDPTLRPGADYYTGYANQPQGCKFKGYYYVFYSNSSTDKVEYSYSTDGETWTYGGALPNEVDLKYGYGREFTVTATADKIFLCAEDDGSDFYVHVLDQNADGTLYLEDSTMILDMYGSTYGGLSFSTGYDGLPYLVIFAYPTSDKLVHAYMFRSSSSSSWVDDATFQADIDISGLMAYNTGAPGFVGSNGADAMVIFRASSDSDYLYKIRWNASTGWGSPEIAISTSYEIHYPAFGNWKDENTFVFAGAQWLKSGYVLTANVATGEVEYTWSFSDSDVDYNDSAYHAFYDDELGGVVGWWFSKTPKWFSAKATPSFEVINEYSTDLAYASAYQYSHALVDVAAGKTISWVADATLDAVMYNVEQYKSAGGVTYSTAVSEYVGVGEAYAKSAGMNVVAQEVITLTDVIPAGQAYDVALFDSVSVGEGVIKHLALSTILVDGVGVQDAHAKEFGGYVSFETGVPLSEQSGVGVAVRFVSPLPVRSVLGGRANVEVGVREGVTLSEKYNAGYLLTHTISESLSLIEESSVCKALTQALYDTITLIGAYSKLYAGVSGLSEGVRVVGAKSDSLAFGLTTHLILGDTSGVGVGVSLKDGVGLLVSYNLGVVAELITRVLVSDVVSEGVKSELLSALGLSERLIIPEGEIPRWEKEVYSKFVLTQLLNSNISVIRKIYSVITKEEEL
ncbi:MAG: hypothetical protein H0Z33_16630 [Bacillaceae bacterium]|nr:hypothetical protein [Bacillaceae bacterium]